jgi:hypothetical protein
MMGIASLNPSYALDCFASLAMTVKAQQAIEKTVIPRHRVSPSASPMTGSSGVSSTPRLLDSITNGSGILDHPLSRMMTAEDVSQIQFSNSSRYSFAISPRVHASFAWERPALGKFRGRRESRVPAAPAASRANFK